jgi:hypothetical protein
MIAKTEKLEKQAENEMAANQKDPKTTPAVDGAAMAEVQRGSPTSMMQAQGQLKANQLEILNDQQRERISRVANFCISGASEFDSGDGGGADKHFPWV